jgi:hypothetical protein
VIATGSLVRRAQLPPGMLRVHYLRTDVQALALKSDLAIEAPRRDRRRSDRS